MKSGGEERGFRPGRCRLFPIPYSLFPAVHASFRRASGAIDELARYFDFTFTDSKSKAVFVLDLTPKNRAVAKRVQRIKLWIDKTTRKPVKTTAQILRDYRGPALFSFGFRPFFLFSAA